jgi:hypothetical protein
VRGKFPRSRLTDLAQGNLATQRSTDEWEVGGTRPGGALLSLTPLAHITAHSVPPTSQ